MKSVSRRYLMLDRDGTVVVHKHYLADPKDIVLISGVGTALRRLQEMGLGIVLISNQSAIGRGIITTEQLMNIHQRLVDLLLGEGVVLNGFFFCPHRPDAGCSCRKPLPGLVFQASTQLKFDPAVGFFVGDNVCDIELGRCIDATTFLVRTGYGSTVECDGQVTADYVVDSLQDVVPIIKDHLHT